MAEMRKYETVFIAKPDTTEEDLTALIEKFKNLINQNGKVESVDDWGVKKLAYPINYIGEGHYVLINFEADVNFIKELERVYNINDVIMRSVIFNKENV